jgi:hypothetical protein
MLKTLRFALTEKSGNIKTGPIPVSVSSRTTCPTTCPFLKGGGCYAAAGYYTRLHWDAVTRGDRGEPLAGFLARIRALPEGQLWRHNVSGDLVATGGRLSRRFLDALTKANQGRRGFTYTHHVPEVGENARLLRRANRGGFRVNVSTESERAADAAIAQGLPAVMAVSSSETRTTWRTPEGNRVLVCPAQRSDTRQCADCALCHTRGRRVIIAFPAHGTGKTKANAVIAEALANG